MLALRKRYLVMNHERRDSRIDFRGTVDNGGIRSRLRHLFIFYSIVVSDARGPVSSASDDDFWLVFSSGESADCREFVY